MKFFFKIQVLLFFLIIGCKDDHNEIVKLLASENKEEVILGAFKAGESGSEDFVPLLLDDAYDYRTSTNIRFKGISVYQSKMGALSKILNAKPPVEITSKPDSTIIEFYNNLVGK